jgi:soluble lytic murein transglycosylase-like protein
MSGKAIIRSMRIYPKTPLFLLGALMSVPSLALAGETKIHCFVDNKGVTNCTNIHVGKPVSAKPPSVVQVQKPVAQAPAANAIAEKTVADAPQVSAAPSLAQIAPTPAAATSAQARATYVYRYKQSNGAALLTNVPQRSLTLVSTSVYQSFEKGWTGSVFKTANWKLNREAYNDTILAMATEKSVDPALVRAVIHAESSFNPTAVSRTGAMGLMQLMPGTAARFGVGNAFDPQENIRGGVSYLRFLLDKFNGDMRLAAAGYNAGEGAVMKYGGVPPYNETTEYVARVLDLHGQYSGAN